ncbi:leucyl aminopeptidase [Roseomonas sp. PWR1]|uniref:Probable cytosol aminopeptidase n=1 Tax=Roseomonas nitratireducens TaxID=2820810 RepID=A0ABS4AV69_9PROT|nr:leucyl aminopeptidase [Neoroseomonas nitratireducens]MBP0465149.1 leucyl aminopeptidase [Neoroseomonas nitratireducens]
MPDIAFVKPALPRAGALVLLLAEEAPLSGLAAQADKAAGGAIARGLEAAKFKGRKGQATTLWAPGGGVSKVLAIGLGKEAEISDAGLEAVGGTIAGSMAMEREASIAADGLTAAQAASVAFGIALKSYRFDRYRTTEKEEDKPKLERVAMGVAETAKAKAAFAPMQAIADGVFLTRDLVSEPPNVLTPVECAERCKALTKLGVEVEVLGPREMKRLGFGALLGVAQGSANEPRMVVMKWMGAPKGKKPAGRPLAFIGKGVTFDTGGISIKPAGGMEDMKWDMAGAGTVIGLMAALAGRKAKADVVGIVGLVENMPSGTAQRPGDVVKTASGQTVEVINTDAEGRLVLADVIHYCIEKYDPRFMIDLATLTGAIIIALGHEHAGLFANDDTLAQRIEAAGRAVGEACWRMPLGDAYDKQIKSDIADMKNVGGRPGGSITAAQFIQRFVQGKPWAHLDIAGTAWSGKDTPTVPKGATAYGVRMLDRLVAEHYEG